MQHIIAFIGGGHMASSLIGGLLQSGYNPSQIWVADPNAEKRAYLQKKWKIQTTESDIEAVKKADITILAVKPQDMRSAGDELKGLLEKHQELIISIAAGIKTTQLHQWFGTHLSIVRAMPNTPALLRSGATALYADGQVSEDEKSLAESILRSVGLTVWVAHEHELDTVTALSGAGPAYFFMIMQALQDSAEKLGLSASAAKLLTMQTMLGAARMAMETDLSLPDLIKGIATQGGITEQGIKVLEQGDLKSLMGKAVEKAKEKATEISKSFES